MQQLNADQQKLLQTLDSLGIKAVWNFHSALFTCDDKDPIVDALVGARTKNLFLQDKFGNLWHIFMLQEGQADLKQLARELGAGRFSFAKPEQLLEQLHLTPGGVTPLGLMFATKSIKLIIDERMQANQIYLMHGLSNDNTIAILGDDFERWLSQYKIDYVYRQIPVK